ncbi:MAG: transposase [Salinisphaera sp.]|uniref:transposase n=1 Tax=Salinisphaera sp. TaxID=1914330 RepID=UPI003C7CD99E
MLGNLKTAINGMYHAFKFAKYAPRYLGEFQYRFNRRYDLRSIKFPVGIGDFDTLQLRGPVRTDTSDAGHSPVSHRDLAFVVRAALLPAVALMFVAMPAKEILQKMLNVLI